VSVEDLLGGDDAGGDDGAGGGGGGSGSAAAASGGDDDGAAAAGGSRLDAPFVPMGDAQLDIQALLGGKKFDRARGWVDADDDAAPSAAAVDAWRD
jgi:hypothetical protein